jgi:hypothetical protein
MYTFSPLASIPASHDGFWIIAVFCIVMLILVLFNEPETFFVWFFIACFPVGIAYGVSYHWTNQEPKVFANVQVTAEFVSYQPEGYNEKSGKSHVDRHYMYVVYSVNGNPVILQAKEGMEYPKTAILYKN